MATVVVLNSDQSDYTFQSGTTYFIAGPVALTGTTTIQGGAIIKYPNDTTAYLEIDGTLVCPANSDAPVVFTAGDDDSIGESVSNVWSDYTGSIGGGYGYGSPMLSFPYDGEYQYGPWGLNNLRFRYAGAALYIEAANSVTLTNSQAMGCMEVAIVDDASGGASSGLPVTCDNCLFAYMQTLVVDESDTENDYSLDYCTLDNCPYLVGIAGNGGGDGSLIATNCIFSNSGDENISGVSGSNNGFYNSPASMDGWWDWDFGSEQVYCYTNPFSAAGAADYYLETDCPFHGVAATNDIDPNLWAQIQTMVTASPRDGHAVDTNGADLGYHYFVNEDSEFDGLPDWWEWQWFGSYGYNGTNLDGNGNTFLYDYANGVAPDAIQFQIQVTNIYCNVNPTPAHLAVQGAPYYIAVLVDDTNFNDAAWERYTSPNITLNLGARQGWHEVGVGLYCYADNPGMAVWQWRRMNLDLTPPSIVVTNPIVCNGAATVSIPMIQLKGYSPEQLGGLSYDLSNAFQTITDQFGGVTSQFYDTNSRAFTTNYFECLDIPLTNGLNTVTIHATDLAGNATVTNFYFTVDYSTKTNPPTIQLYWPLNGAKICQSSFTWRGLISDPTATVTAQMVDTNGNTNTFNGIVERDGKFWIEGLPTNGTGLYTLQVTDVVGNVATTNIAVMPGDLALTLSPPADTSLWNPTVTVTGTISDSSDYALWVNGVEATLNGDGTWTANGVPVTPGGTAVFQARAIPNTDNGGNGSGGGGGGPVGDANLGNPDSTGAEDAGAEPDKPAMIYMKSYNEYQFQEHSDLTGKNYDGHGNQTGSQEGVDDSNSSLNWDNQSGGGSSDTETFVQTVTGTFANNLDDVSTEDDYESSFLADGTGTQIHDWTVTDESNPANDATGSETNDYILGTLVGEHCDLQGTLDAITSNPGYYSETHDLVFNRSAQAKFELQTGGKAVPGRQSLFILSAGGDSGDLVLAPAWSYEYGYYFNWAADVPLDPTDIKILGKNLDANGNLYTILPEGETLDATPIVSSQNYYTWSGPSMSKHTLTIEADGADISTNTPEFCVGQNITFSPVWIEGGDPGETSATYRWTFSGPYVNASSQNGSSGSQNYYIDGDVLNLQNPYGVWYTSGGKSAYLHETLHFSGGETITLNPSGQFTMFRPSVVMINPTVEGAPTVIWERQWGSFPSAAIQLGSPGGPNDMDYHLGFISSDYSGSTQIIQICNIDSSGMGGSCSGCLDGTGPYSRGFANKGASANNNVLALDDAPDANDSLTPGDISLSDTFTDYVLFYPGQAYGQWNIPLTASTAAIFVPIAIVTWGVNGSATSPGMTISQDHSGPTGPTDSEAFPQWTTTF